MLKVPVVIFFRGVLGILAAQLSMLLEHLEYFCQPVLKGKLCLADFLDLSFSA